MLKNANELNKLASNAFTDWVTDTSHYAALGAKTPYQFLTNNVQSWGNTQYNRYKERLGNFTLSDLQSVGKMLNNPEAVKLLPKFMASPDFKNMSWADFNRRSAANKGYVPGQATWAYNNVGSINNVKSFGSSPILTMLFGDYNNARNAMDMLDRYGMSGTNENKFLKGHISAAQYKSYQRWRPLMAAWMNIRGWIRSLFSGEKFNAMRVSHPVQPVQPAAAAKV